MNTGRRVVERLVPDSIETTEDAASPQNLSSLENLNQSVHPAIFRSIIERDNLLILRGTAQPNVVVSILGNNERRGQVRANEDGIWDAEIDISEDQILSLSLTSFLDENVRVNGDELLLRIAHPASENEDVADASADNNSSALIGTSQPLILLTAPGGPSRVIQTPFRQLPSRNALTLEAVEYDDLGGVIFSGFSSRAGRVRIYGDGELIGESGVGSNGRWYFIAAETLPESNYNLRVQLQEDNGLETNIEVNLRRLSPRQNIDSNPFVAFNDTVWHVRRALHGGGVQYTAILSPDSIIELDEGEVE